MNIVWIILALVACLVQSGMFSGLNLAMFSVSRLRLEVEAEAGDPDAKRVLALRKDSNFLLTTILWANVAVNTLLAQLTESVLAGAAGFAAATFAITFFGEIVPQAWFSRNALRMGSLLAPVLRVYQVVLWPVARPSAWLLDRWLGSEGAAFFAEEDLRRVIVRHMEAEESDVERVEGLGALNFLDLDDLPISEEGEVVDPASVIMLPRILDLPLLPDFDRTAEDPFVRQVQASGRKWVILTDEEEHPRLVLDANAFLRNVLLEDFDPYAHCHRPIIVTDPELQLGRVLRELTVNVEHPGDDVIDQDLILLWAPEHRRVITGADLLGRLLRGITTRSVQAENEDEEPGR